MNNITKVYLLNVPLENDYKHTLYFNSKEGQINYFLSKKVKEYTNFTYQRKDSFIRVPDHFDNLQNVNYVAYQNSAYSNKWFFAFVTDIKYVDDGRTDLIIETDYIQTWYFDYTVKPSFVEREHVSDDAVGLHTIPEGLETGPYVNQYLDIDERSGFNYINESYVCMGVSEIGLDITVPNGEKKYGGVFNGLYYLVFPTMLDAETYIRVVQTNVSGDNINNIFMIPKDIVDVSSGSTFTWIKHTEESKTFEFAYLPYTNTAVDIKLAEVFKTDHLDGSYTPKNKKLLTYPFKYFNVSNNAGASATYKYEDWSSDKCKFSIRGTVTPGCSIKLIPYDHNTGKSEYNYTFKDYIEGLDAGKLPTCGWVNDSYTNWLTANAVNIPLNIVTSTISGAVGGATAGSVVPGFGTGAGAVVGVFSGAVTSVTSSMAQMYEQSLMPATAKGGVTQGDYNFAEGLCFSVYKKSIKEEYARCIDKYFDMFGYKVNMVKTPNIHHRARYWYTKTIDVNIDGAIPSKDMQVIKNAYNNGITFWRNASEIQNYDLDNYITDIV